MENVTSDQAVRIDPHSLDSEWLKQPGLVKHYATLQADARQDYEDANVNLDLVTAELDRDVRANPEKHGLAKPTEKSIASVIQVSDAFADAKQTVIEARHHMDVVQAVVSALDHKKRALEKLVDLFLADYFSRPSASEESKEDVGRMVKRSARRKGMRRDA